mmetsp:Transcript_150601/g.419782  ORF Transcript_150601/g.419782 Transcript_150601/m.419782 type:complete len:249 (-) Transcript_150601:65-811(-)
MAVAVAMVPPPLLKGQRLALPTLDLVYEALAAAGSTSAAGGAGFGGAAGAAGEVAGELVVPAPGAVPIPGQEPAAFVALTPAALARRRGARPGFGARPRRRGLAWRRSHCPRGRRGSGSRGHRARQPLIWLPRELHHAVTHRSPNQEPRGRGSGQLDVVERVLGGIFNDNSWSNRSPSHRPDLGGPGVCGDDPQRRGVLAHLQDQLAALLHDPDLLAAAVPIAHAGQGARRRGRGGSRCRRRGQRFHD